MVITYVVTSWTRIYNDTDRDAQSGSRSSCGRQQRLAFAAWLLHTNLAKALKCQTLWKMLGSLETKTRWQSCWWTSIGTRIACSSVYIYTRRMFTCTSSLFSAVNGFLDRSNLSWNVISVLPMLASAGEVHQHSRGDHSQEKCDHGVGGWGMAHRKRNEGERMDCDPCM